MNRARGKGGLMRNWRSGMALLLALVGLLIASLPLLGRVSPLADAFASFTPLAIPFALAGAALGLKPLRWPVLALSSLALALLIAMLLRELEPSPPPSHVKRERGDLVIVTHNLLMNNVDPEATIAMLRGSGADILLLQEAKGRIGPMLSRLDDLYPYHTRCPGECDLALFSRIPMGRPRLRLRTADGRPYGPPLLWTRIRPADGPSFLIATLHQPWPLPPGPQAEERAALIEALGHVDRASMILTGDFNLTPWSAAMARIDMGVLPMRRVTRALGSFPARLPVLGVPFPILPIDHVFIGPDWRVRSIERLERGGSDHYPVRITLYRAR